jgi:hypothetical protein
VDLNRLKTKFRSSLSVPSSRIDFNNIEYLISLQQTLEDGTDRLPKRRRRRRRRQPTYATHNG